MRAASLSHPLREASAIVRVSSVGAPLAATAAGGLRKRSPYTSATQLTTERSKVNCSTALRGAPPQIETGGVLYQSPCAVATRHPPPKSTATSDLFFREHAVIPTPAWRRGTPRQQAMLDHAQWSSATPRGRAFHAQQGSQELAPPWDDSLHPLNGDHSQLYGTRVTCPGL